MLDAKSKRLCVLLVHMPISKIIVDNPCSCYNPTMYGSSYRNSENNGTCIETGTECYLDNGSFYCKNEDINHL